MFDDYVFDVWGCEPSHRTGSSYEGTVCYSWRAVFVKVGRASNGPYYKTMEEAQAARDRLNDNNTPF